MAETKKRSLLDCKGEDDVIALPRSLFERKNFSILTDGYRVWLGEQAVGESPTQNIEIPKGDFDFLIRKYTTPQPIDPPVRAE